MNEIFAFIEAEKTTHNIAWLCRLLNVARSSFYAWRAAAKDRAARRAGDEAVAHEITVIHLASRHTYGIPRIHAELRRLGRRVNRRRIARLMRERGIQGAHRRRRRSLTRPDKEARPAPDLIGRDFHAERPGTELVGDITFLPTAEGWLYLACWLDLATREVVGYAMADHHRASLVVDALRMAHGRGDLQPDVLRIRIAAAPNANPRSNRADGRRALLGEPDGRGSAPGQAQPGHSPRQPRRRRKLEV
ncbi:IS3 family transposase [Streptomyces sp. NPDC102437]|uniref:IS3 family transposase n=1 Tax=Streptomyces sp. NPDC102437 TaxID=3366175 RepID=UPI00381127A9